MLGPIRICARSTLLLGWLWNAPAAAVTINWTHVGDPGNSCYSQTQGCFGSVGYAYDIGTYEVTISQYTEFLNAVGASDTHGLYNPTMASRGITQNGSAGSYTYTVQSGYANRPVDYVSWSDAARFANWLDNGQPTGAQDSTTTESGAYTFGGGTPLGSARQATASIFLASENEWFKAAYYDPSIGNYFVYPTHSNTTPVCADPTSTPNRANCAGAGPNDELVDVGSYPGSLSAYGTFDQAGNVFEWNETVFSGYTPDGYYETRGERGGASYMSASEMAASVRGSAGGEGFGYGFRVASSAIPEPGTASLVALGLVGLAAFRRTHA